MHSLKKNWTALGAIIPEGGTIYVFKRSQNIFSKIIIRKLTIIEAWTQRFIAKLDRKKTSFIPHRLSLLQNSVYLLLQITYNSHI